MPPNAAKLREALLVAAEQIQKQKAIIEAQSEILCWSFGDGFLPVDEEAELAAWGYLWALAVDGGHGAMLPYLRLARPLLTTRCPPEFHEPTMLWSEALRRLREAAELRCALGRIRLASRRAVAGDRIGTIRALRGAVDSFGEPKASRPVELQWRAAELEVEIRELEMMEGGCSRRDGRADGS